MTMIITNILVHFIVDAIWSNSRPIKELGHAVRNLLYRPHQQQRRKSFERHALEPSAIPAILALFSSHDPLTALDVEIDAPGSVAALHIADGLLRMALLNEMPHERLVPDRTPL
jgi:hypothetical protein